MLVRDSRNCYALGSQSLLTSLDHRSGQEGYRGKRGCSPRKQYDSQLKRLPLEINYRLEWKEALKQGSRVLSSLPGPREFGEGRQQLSLEVRDSEGVEGGQDNKSIFSRGGGGGRMPNGGREENPHLRSVLCAGEGKEPQTFTRALV